MIGDVASNLEALSPDQYVLAFLFMCTYALALGRLLEGHGRAVCAASSVAAAVAFVVRCAAWEPGVVMVAIALVGMGAFSAAVWILWTLATWRGSGIARTAPTADAGTPVAAAPPLGASRLGTAGRPG